MSNSWLRTLSLTKRRHLFNSTATLLPNSCSNDLFRKNPLPVFTFIRQYSNVSGTFLGNGVCRKVRVGGRGSNVELHHCPHHCLGCQWSSVAGFCSVVSPENDRKEASESDYVEVDLGEEGNVSEVRAKRSGKEKKKEKAKVEEKAKEKSVDFTKVPKELLPTVLIIGRPNVGKSALFNRLIRRREALVYNTPDDHVTRDIREAIAKLGDLRFRVLDSAGLEAVATSGSILGRTADMTANVLSKSQFALFLISARDGLHTMDLQVGKWLRKHASGISTILVMNKSESLDETDGSLAVAAGEAYGLGFGDPIPISAETGLGMTELYEALRPLLEKYMLQVLSEKSTVRSTSPESEESELSLQLAIVGRPNVGKSTLLNTLLQEQRVLVGPEAGLTRDSIRAQFEYEGRTIYMVDTAGWLERSKEKGPASLSIVQTKKNLMRAHIVALVLDADEVAKTGRTLNHAEVSIARQAVEEGRGLVVIVNKMDLMKGKQKYDDLKKAVPEEIQKLIPQVTGIPVLFVSALEGKGRIAVMRQVIETYEKWCLRLSTGRLNRWLAKVMSRHSWKNQVGQPKIKYFTQVKARPPTFVAFMKGKTELPDTDIRFLTRSLKEDFDMGGIPVRIMQRFQKDENTKNHSFPKSSHPGTAVDRTPSDKRLLIK